MMPSARKDTMIFLLILLLAAALRVWHSWEYPLHYDEATHANKAARMMDLLTPFDNINSYQGPVIAYALMPSLLLFGRDLLFLRLTTILFSLATIALLYLFTKSYYNTNVALLAAFILATTPNDILSSSITTEVTLIPFFMMLALLLFQRFAASGKNAYLYLFAFISGVAINARLSFLFFLAAFFLAVKFVPIACTKRSK